MKAIAEGLMALQRRSSLINIGKISANVEHADEHMLEHEISALEARYNTLKAKMRNMKQEALERIGKEYLLNNY